MRGFFPPPPPPACPDHGDPIKGYIKNGRKYPNGCVPDTVYQADKQAMESEIRTLKQAVDNMSTSPAPVQSAVAITAFTVTPATAEMGSSQNVVLAWSVTGNPQSITLNGNPVSGTNNTQVGVTQSTTYTLAASGGVTKTAKIDFFNQIYWGVAVDSTGITGMSKALSGEKKRSISVNVGAGEYIFYAYPKRLGTVVFNVNGFTGGFEAPQTVSLTNASGYTEEYYVYKSENSGLGPLTVVIGG